MTHREVILGPDDYFFVTDPPSKEYELPTASLSDVRGFVVRPALAVTYDVPLSAGYYVSPSLKLETIIGSLSQKHSWSSYGVSLGVSLARGL
jgi:hypothetical protein